MRSFACGGCSKTYKSYPALYLHIKRKHDGIKPPNTVTMKSLESPTDGPTPTGRPHKPLHNIDDVAKSEIDLEIIENICFHQLGEKMLAIHDFTPKPKLEDVVSLIAEINKDKEDKPLKAIQNKIDEYYKGFKARFPGELEIELDDQAESLDINDTTLLMAWFLIWMGKFHIKLEFLPDLCLLISKVWNVLEDLGLTVRDIDNKIVWKKVVKECETIYKDFTYLNSEPELLSNFTQNICKMIDKIFQGDVNI